MPARTPGAMQAIPARRSARIQIARASAKPGEPPAKASQRSGFDSPSSANTCIATLLTALGQARSGSGFESSAAGASAHWKPLKIKYLATVPQVF